jgi:hypothetical protein
MLGKILTPSMKIYPTWSHYMNICLNSWWCKLRSSLHNLWINNGQIGHPTRNGLNHQITLGITPPHLFMIWWLTWGTKFLKFISTNLMDPTLQDLSLRWNITFPYTTSEMTWWSFTWVSYILILNIENGGNGIRTHVGVILLGHNLYKTSMNTLK